MDGAHCEDVGGNSNEEVGSHQTETNDEIKKLQDLLNQLSTPLEESEAVEEPTYLDDGAAKFATQQNTLARTLLPMRSFTYYTGLLFDWFPRGRAQSLREYWPSTVVIICSITILFATILFFLSQMFSKAMSVGAELSLFHILLPSFMWCFPLFLACFTQIYYLNLILCNKIQQFLQHWRLLEESLKRLPIATNINNSHSSRISRCVRNMKKIDVRVYWVIFTLQISLFSTSLYFITQSTMQCTDSFQINPAANDNITQSTEQNSNGQGNTDKFLVFPLSCDLEEMIEISDTSSSQPATYYSDTTTFDEAVGNRSRNASNRLMLVMAVNGTDYKSSTEASRNAINKLFLMDYPQLNCGHYNCKWICYFYACLHIASMVLVTVFVSLADLVPAFVYSHAATAAHTLRDFILRTDIPVTVQVANPTADSGESLTPTEKHFFRIWLHYEAIRVMVKRADSLFGLLVVVNHGMTFFMICASFFSLFGKVWIVDNTVMQIVIFSAILIRITMSLWLTIRLHRSSDPLLCAILRKFNLSNHWMRMNVRERDLLRSLLRRLENNHLTAIPSGLYQITPPRFLTLLSLIITYTLILLQVLLQTNAYNYRQY